MKIALLTISLLLSATRAIAGEVYYIPAQTEVDYGLAGFLHRAIEEAKQKEAQAIIFGIDTFGGRVDACLEIANHIVAAKPVPTYAYIEDKAWSAGALIALSCDKIFMRSGSSIGSAAPVTGGTGKSEALGEKYVSALRAKFRATAEKKGYPANLAAAMVDKDLEVKEVRVNGEKKYLTDDEIGTLKKEKKKVSVGKKITKKNKLLNLTSEQAKNYGMATDLAERKQDILNLVGLEGSQIMSVERNWAENFAGLVTGSMLSGLLLTIGLLALYLEFQAPGFGWPGVTGLICLSLVFWGKYMVHLAQWTELILIGIGILLILAEIFIIPGFGIAGIGGIVLLLVGIYLSYVPFFIPQAPWDFQMFQDTLLILLTSLTATSIGILVIAYYMPSIPLLNRLVLAKTISNDEKPTTRGASEEEILGRKGVCLTDLRPVGRARFGGKILEVVADSTYISKGSKVSVTEVKNNRILVRQT